jgi:hypothetical protein
MAVATMVTQSVATKKGMMPKVGGSETGYHLVPKKNSQGGVYQKAGKPSFSRRAITPSRTIMVSMPARKIQPSMNFSPKRHRRLRLSVSPPAVVTGDSCFSVLSFTLLLHYGSGT